MSQPIEVTKQHITLHAKPNPRPVMTYRGEDIFGSPSAVILTLSKNTLSITQIGEDTLVSAYGVESRLVHESRTDILAALDRYDCNQALGTDE